MRAPFFLIYAAVVLKPRKGRHKGESRWWRGREWRWKLKGANGEIVAHGEGYTRKADCLRAVRMIQGLSPDAKVRS